MVKLKKQQEQIIAKDTQLNKIYVLLFIFAFGLYANTIFHNYALDDQIACVYNKYVQMGFKGIPTLFTHGYAYGFIGDNTGAYRPIPLVVFAIGKQLFGNSPKVLHFFNVLLYSITGVFLYRLLSKFLKNYNKYLSLIIALLFIAHPIHTEVVANIKSLDEILSFLFLILTLTFILEYRENMKKNYLYFSMLCFLFALLSKENAITFLAVIPLLFYFFYDYDLKKLIQLIFPFLIVSAVYFVMRVLFLNPAESVANFNSGASDVLNNSLAAVHNSSEKLATISKITGMYLKLLVFPHPLVSDYSFNQITIVNWSSLYAIVSMAIILVLAIYSVINIKSKNLLVLAILIFLITYSVVSNLLVDIGATLAERFMYVPSLGFCIALAVIIFKGFKVEKENLPVPLMVIVCLILFIYSFKTFSRNKDWKDNLTLFTSDIKFSPNSARLHYAYGSTLNSFADAERNDSKKVEMQYKAIEEMKKAVSIFPAYTEVNSDIALTYGKIGLSAGESGDIKKSISLFHNGIYYDQKNPSLYLNLGVACLKNNDPDSAVYYIQKSINLKNDNPEALSNLGVAYGNIGVKYHSSDPRKAITYYRKGLFYNGQQLNLYNNLRLAYMSIGRTDSTNYFNDKGMSLSKTP